jgi:PAS domain S-box-containing protein
MPEDGAPSRLSAADTGRAAVLLDLEDRLRPLEDAGVVRRRALEIIGARLGAARAAWWEDDGGAPRLRAAWPDEATLLDPEGSSGPVLTLAPSWAGATLLFAPPPGRGWSAEEAALAQEAAERAGAAVRRAASLARLREGEARSRAQAEEVAAVYAGAPIGLCVLDREGRYLRINDVLAAGNGLPPEAHLGRTLREVLPGLAPAVEPLLARALAGEELRGVEVAGTTPAASGRLRTWRESFVPLRDPSGRIAGVTISVEEVTEEKAAERRQAYLLRLEERLRAARDPREALTGACALLGEELGASLAGLSRIEDDGEHIVIDSEWRPGRGASTIGRHRLADYGPERAGALAEGRTVVVRDARSDSRVPDPAAYEAFGARAVVETPLLRGGRLRGHLFVCDDRVRDWSEDDLALVRETADRAWEAAERARAEARLRESEARFRQLAETIREVFYVLEVDERRMSYVSPAYEEVWGRPRAEVLADAWTFLAQVHPDDRAQVQATADRLWSGEPVSSDYRLVRPDGAVRHIHDRAALVTDPATGRRRAFGLAADVTDRRKVEERLHLATEAAGIGIFDVDLLTGAIDWDPRLRELWGVGPDVTVTDDVFAGGVHPEDCPAMREAIARTLAPGGDGLYRAEYRLAPRDGTAPRWIAAAGRAHFEGGRAVRFVGTVQDVSTRKAAEAAVIESEERFRALANTVPALIFITAPGRGNVYSNERYQAYTGLGREGLLGDGWRRAIHPGDLGRVAEAWEQSDATGQDYAVEVRVRRHDGVFRWHLTRGIPVHDAAGRIVQWVGTGTDVEEIVEAREALAASRAAVEQANAELEARVAERTASLGEANARLAAEIERREAVQAALVQSQKLEAVGQLTSGIAHDFNNVIAAIAGGFSVIERRTQDPRLLEVARHGAKAAERGGALVKQLLAFARQQVLTPQACDLRALLSEAEPLVARSLGTRVELAVDCPEGLPRCGWTRSSSRRRSSTSRSTRATRCPGEGVSASRRGRAPRAKTGPRPWAPFRLSLSISRTPATECRPRCSPARSTRSTPPRRPARHGPGTRHGARLRPPVRRRPAHPEPGRRGDHRHPVAPRGAGRSRRAAPGTRRRARPSLPGSTAGGALRTTTRGRCAW